ncbi:MAG: MBL fold metallo-hydrolase [Nitrospirae bacterium]|nr:MBL fold metallo-hydrolase [Nitrospirota bacterium]
MKKEFSRGRFTVLSVIVFALIYSLTFVPAATAQGGLTKIAGNVYSYADVKQGSPANSFGANSGIVIGEKGILVIDTLISAKEAQSFIRDIRAVSDKPMKYVVNTHSHLDHTFGNSEFEKFGAVIISHENCKLNMEKQGEAALKNAKVYGLTDKDMEGTMIAYPALTFSDRMEIDLGNQKVELIFHGASHTNDSIMVCLPDKKIVFAGDILFTGYHPFMADGDIDGWVKVLDHISSMGDVTIIPGHGPVSGKKDIEDMKNYLISFDKKAKELAANSGDAAQIASEIKKSLPSRPEGESMIPANIQMKYLKK